MQRYWMAVGLVVASGLMWANVVCAQPLPDCDDVAICELRCKQDDAAACYAAGQALGSPSMTDAKANRRAAVFWEKACGLNHIEACTELARLHRPWHADECDGTFYYQGIEGDEAVAQGALRRACGFGHAASCEELEAIKKRFDPSRRDCADNPESSSCFYLGEAIAKGTHGEPADPVAALPVLTPVCLAHNSEEACELLKALCKKKAFASHEACKRGR